MLAGPIEELREKGNIFNSVLEGGRIVQCVSLWERIPNVGSEVRESVKIMSGAFGSVWFGLAWFGSL